jgi:hypothetical protein
MFFASKRILILFSDSEVAVSQDIDLPLPEWAEPVPDIAPNTGEAEPVPDVAPNTWHGEDTMPDFRDWSASNIELYGHDSIMQDGKHANSTYMTVANDQLYCEWLQKLDSESYVHFNKWYRAFLSSREHIAPPEPAVPDTQDKCY